MGRLIPYNFTCRIRSPNQVAQNVEPTQAQSTAEREHDVHALQKVEATETRVGWINRCRLQQVYLGSKPTVRIAVGGVCCAKYLESIKLSLSGYTAAVKV